MKACLPGGLQPIFCIGETLKEKEEGKNPRRLGDPTRRWAKGLSEKETERIVIAYEPVWAIGTGKTANPDQAEEVHRFIRRKLEGLYSGRSLKPSVSNMAAALLRRTSRS